MALLFIDSFDHYLTADITEKWTGNTAMVITAAAGRRSSAALEASNNAAVNGVSVTLAPSGTTAIVGAAFRMTTSSVTFVQILSSGTVQASVFINASGLAAAYRGSVSGGTLLSTAVSGAIASNTFAYVEAAIVVHPSAGSVVIRVNGVEVLNLPTVNTAATGTAAWNGIRMGGANLGTGTWRVDDLYILDGSGAAPWNAILGDCRVDVRLPTAAGATTGWTPLAGANWDAVNDTAPDDDTTYTAAATAGLTDTFVTQDAPVVGAAIYGVQHCVNMKKTDSGICTVAPVIRHGGVDYPGASLSPGTGYAFGIQIAATNPGTGAAWTEAGFNAAEFGYKRLT